MPVRCGVPRDSREVKASQERQQTAARRRQHSAAHVEGRFTPGPPAGPEAWVRPRPRRAPQVRAAGAGLRLR
eukprot:1477738-Lingulodinium_polyedra.AAC.1